MREPVIKIAADLYERATRCAAKAGYSSTEEFIAHAIETEITSSEDGLDDTNRSHELQGLGYLDAGSDI